MNGCKRLCLAGVLVTAAASAPRAEEVRAPAASPRATAPLPVRGEGSPAAPSASSTEVGPVEPLVAPTGLPSPAPAAATPASPSTAPPPAARWKPPSFLDPLPGTPGGPPLPPPDSVEPFSKPTPFALRLGAGLAWRLGDAPRDVPPRLGWGLGASFLTTVAAPARGLSLRGRFDLFHHRFAATDHVIQEDDQGPKSLSAVRLVNQTSFLVGPELAIDFGVLRATLGVASGLSIGYFHSIAPAFRPGDLTAYEVVFAGDIGLFYRWSRLWAFGVRGAWRTPAWPRVPRLEGDGSSAPHEVFGPWTDVGLAAEYGF